MIKTLNNSDIKGAKKQVPDLELFGNGDLFQLLSKASSKSEGWMKSTKAMNIAKLGCIIQCTTQQDGQVAEAVCFIPGARIHEAENGYRCIVQGVVGVKQRKMCCPDCEGEGSIQTNSEPGVVKKISCDFCWGSGQLLVEPVITLSE